MTYVDMAAGTYHSVACRSDGAVVAWGDNSLGQCQTGNVADAIEIAAGESHGIALRADGSVAVWGSNTFGQYNVPPPGSGFAYTGVAAGAQHVLARRSDGWVVAAGFNVHGECVVPQPPVGLSYLAVQAREFSSLALRSDGAVVGWGSNAYHQLAVLGPPDGHAHVSMSAGYTKAVAIASPAISFVGGPTPGCRGSATIWTNSLPNLGNGTFTITCDNMHPSIGGVIALGFAGVATPFFYDGVRIWMDPAMPIVTAYRQSNSLGRAGYHLPLPNHATFAGLSLWAQWIPLEPAGCTQHNVSSSTAIRITLQS